MNLSEIEHHGIKGMHWGVRKEDSSGDSHSKAKKVAIGVTVVGGAAAAAYILNKTGRVPTSSFKGQRGPAQKLLNDLTKSQSVRNKGPIVKVIPSDVWKTKVSSLSKEIADANASQDQWMRSIGLGAVVNNRS